MITIDNLASRYHLLPSQVLAQANTFDLRVLNTSTLWEKHKNREAEAGDAKTFGTSSNTQTPDMDTMQKMMIIAKNKKNGDQSKSPDKG